MTKVKNNGKKMENKAVDHELDDWVEIEPIPEDWIKVEKHAASTERKQEELHQSQTIAPIAENLSNDVQKKRIPVLKVTEVTPPLKVSHNTQTFMSLNPQAPSRGR